MFKKLKQRWGVSGINLLLILCTFALGGSLCGFAGRELMKMVDLDKGFFWVLLYIILVTVLWPFCVLLISIPFGQYSFFTQYLKKIWGRISGNKKAPVSIAIFASGAGSNAEKIIERMHPSNKHSKGQAKVVLIVSNKPGAGVISIAAKYKIETLIIDKEKFFRGDGYVDELKSRGVEFIVLAGFLWKVPVSLLRAYANKIINIHPALLPKYGGKGMYGAKVHEAILASGDKESGITIHYVDELYDHGNIIFQAKCAVDQNDTADTLAQRIHLLEHRHYPEVIEALLQMQNRR